MYETFKSKAIEITAPELPGARQRNTLAAVHPLDQTIVLMSPPGSVMSSKIGK